MQIDLVDLTICGLAYYVTFRSQSKKYAHLRICEFSSAAPARYNWNAFAGAVARRVHDEGMPASQGELVRDMLEWFAASGRVPDESTVRRRVQALWPVLTRRAG